MEACSWLKVGPPLIRPIFCLEVIYFLSALLGTYLDVGFKAKGSNGPFFFAHCLGHYRTK